MTRSKVKVTSPLSLEIWLFSKAVSSAIYNGSWPTNHWFLNYGTMSKFDRAGFVIFVLVCVSHDFELDRNVSCDEYGANLLLLLLLML